MGAGSGLIPLRFSAPIAELDPRTVLFRDVFMNYELFAYFSYYAPKLDRSVSSKKWATKISSFKGNLSVLQVLFMACFGIYNQ
ncbi:MAG: hypothetical protein ACXWT0_13985 [Methylobacter sp.]